MNKLTRSLCVWILIIFFLFCLTFGSIFMYKYNFPSIMLEDKVKECVDNDNEYFASIKNGGYNFIKCSQPEKDVWFIRL